MKSGLAHLVLPARAFAVSIFALAALSATTHDVRADEPAPGVAQHEAGKHFERGVALYAESDYQGALVEFKRAYAIAPNPVVLYNIGEAQFQLQDYANALTSFTRYLGEAPAGAGHRGEVESNLEVLRSRVGHLTIVTLPTGADVAVDDVPAGKTPLPDRVLLSVGHRKVTASLAGHPVATRYVDVAADDNVSVILDLSTSGPDTAPATPSPGHATTEVRPTSGGGSTLRTIGWITAGMLALGAGGSGALAIKESNDLKTARSTFPTSAAVLQDDSDRARTYSILADSLAVGALVVGGITLLSTLTSGGGARTERAAKLRVAPASIDLEVAF